MSTPRTASDSRRLSREQRRRQLLEVAWKIVRNQGREALTLAHVANEAGVSKPIAYDHFGSRTGLLAELYREYDERQNKRMDAAITSASDNLDSLATVIADSYVECVVAQGREIPGVSAALSGSAELEAIRTEYEAAFMEKFRSAFAGLIPRGEIALPALRSVLGAAEALSFAASRGEITEADAKLELAETIRNVVGRR